MRIRTLLLAALLTGASATAAETRLRNPNDDPALGDAMPGQQFGASLAIDGATLAVGSLTGIVYLYVRDGNAWAQQAALTAPANGSFERFGAAVALADDTLVVGAPSTSQDGGFDTGAAHVYARTNGTWSHVQTLTAAVPSAGEFFGEAIALAGDRLAISAPQVNRPGADDAGAVTLFERTPAGWVVRQTIVASSPSQFARFGSALAFAGDHLIVGADGENLQRGGAYAFARGEGGWVERQHLAGSDTVASDFFGTSLASDGTRLLVGAPGSPSARAGRVIEYRRVGDGWVEAGDLDPAGAATPQRFGVALAQAAGRFVVGAERFDASSRPIAAEVHTYAVDNGELAPVAQVGLPLPAGSGWGLRALATDGDRTYAGIPGSAAASASHAGEVRVLAANGDVVATIDRGRTPHGEQFGYALAATARWLFVGAPGERARSKLAGAVYAYDLDPTNAAATSASVARIEAGAAADIQAIAEPRTLIAADGVRDSRAGYALATSGDTLLVGTPGRDGGGVVDLYAHDGAQWALTTRWTAPAGAIAFGREIAADASAVAVAAPLEGTANGGSEGAAYVFERADGGWAAPVRLAATTSDRKIFGTSVAIDGALLVVGSNAYELNDVSFPVLFDGAAHVFERRASGWIERARLVRPALPTEAFAGTGQFGWAVATVGDTVFVGDPARREVHIFRRVADAWTWMQRIAAPAGAAGPFGHRLRIANGELWVGSPDADPLKGSSAHRYRAVDGHWVIVQSIGTGDAEHDNLLGSDIVVLGDAVYLGAPNTRGRSAPMSGAGSVRVEELDVFAGGFED